ncbi:hypothetical protein TorRG33x02_001030, partial [Trema orientale]
SPEYAFSLCTDSKMQNLAIYLADGLILPCSFQLILLNVGARIELTMSHLSRIFSLCTCEVLIDTRILKSRSSLCDDVRILMDNFQLDWANNNLRGQKED